MMLLYTQWVGVACGQVARKILFDVVANAKARTELDHALREAAPVNRPREGAVVDATDLEEVDKALRRLDDRQTALHIQHWLQAYPSENTLGVKGLERCDAITRESSTRLPLSRKCVVEAG